MNNLFNQKEYLERINYSGSLSPTLHTLKNLQSLHLLNIPFENLDIHYNNTITLNLNHIFHKMVTKSRGGFCFELNGLFYKLLKSIGFDVYMIAGGVFKKDDEYHNEFGHLSLIATIDGIKYLTDVGFGRFSFTPLKIELNKIQNDTHGKFIFDQYNEEYLRINNVVDGEKVPGFIFKDQPRVLKDFEKMCTFHQTNKESHFTQKKIISIPTMDGRITLSSEELIIHKNGSTSNLKVKDDQDFEDHLWNYFKIKMA